MKPAPPTRPLLDPHIIAMTVSSHTPPTTLNSHRRRTIEMYQR